jgi:peroxiredoxin
MSLCLTAALAACLAASPLDHSPAVELRYSGTLTRAGRGAKMEPEKKFTLLAFVSSPSAETRRVFYVLDETGGGNWPWPGRFGALEYSSAWQAGRGVPLHLLHNHDGNPVTVVVQPPILTSPEPLAEGATWTIDRNTAEVAGSEKRGDRDCWEVRFTTGVGRRRTVFVDKTAPLVTGYEERLFMGQGDEFALKVSLDGVKPVDAAAWDKLAPTIDTFLKLREDLKRDVHDIKPELSSDQLALAATALEQVRKTVEGTALAPLSAAITRDVRGQQQRVDDVGKLAGKQVGQKAPELNLVGLDKRPIDPTLLKDKIVVLHFWPYHEEPLLEPYGQVAYLDFLHGKRRKLGVQIVGVAVDERFGDAGRVPTAIRDVNKFKGFMNLSYPIATDDGSLLAKFGDPRRVGAKLPLWVVITPDQKIAYYQAGLYKVNTDEGLKELDDFLIGKIREKAGK